MVIFCNTTKAATTSGGGSGQKPGVGDFSKENTAHMLKIIERVLPIGSEGWVSVGRVNMECIFQAAVEMP